MYHDFETAAESAAQRLTRVAAANAAVVTAAVAGSDKQLLYVTSRLPVYASASVWVHYVVTVCASVKTTRINEWAAMAIYGRLTTMFSVTGQ